MYHKTYLYQNVIRNAKTATIATGKVINSAGIFLAGASVGILAVICGRKASLHMSKSLQQEMFFGL